MYGGMRDDHQISRKDEFPVDIVAVHGLNGDPFRTWTAADKKGGGANWLRDLLLLDFPGSRIVSFGYPSELFNSPDTGNLDTAARNLLQSLLDVRRSRHVC